MHDVQHIVVTASDIPIFPTHYMEIMDYARGGDASIDRLVELTEKDVGLVEIVMKAANSAYYGMTKVRTVRQAVVRVGLDAFCGFVLSGAVKRLVRESDVFERMFWEHSVRVAECSRWIARQWGLEGDEAYVWGIMHDVGWIIIHLKIPQLAEKAVRMAMDRVSQGDCLHDVVEDAEREVYGFSHSEVGCMVVSKWALGEDLGGIVAAHHRPESQAAKVVWLAESFCPMLPLVVDYERAASVLGVSSDDVYRWHAAWEGLR